MGDSVTTDHISPVSVIRDGPAFDHLARLGVSKRDMSSFGARRGNAEVMVRGTFANPRLRNLLLHDIGPRTLHIPTGDIVSVYEAAQRYREAGRDMVVVAGKEYGTGSSRDWAAKGTALLGVRAVLAESFERIHRSNLVGMGVLPLVFAGAEQHGLTGRELFSFALPEVVTPGAMVEVTAVLEGAVPKIFEAKLRLDTPMEVKYWRHGGILPYVLETLR
uniref:Aconitase A/isopropylmalate dehydratase small subunit swivel domain-containing protein n=1 Tax=Noctiluca scintillans TaxID=2966 RepID=A0A7S0ZMM2_NOCSC